MFETSVSDLQSGLTVENGAITGTLKKLSTGPIADYWGEGYFMALKFTDNDEGEATIKVGMKPSASDMGLVELDEDMNGVFMVTNKASQKLVVETSDGTYTAIQEYDLSGLTLQD